MNRKLLNSSGILGAAAAALMMAAPAGAQTLQSQPQIVQNQPLLTPQPPVNVLPSGVQIQTVRAGSAELDQEDPSADTSAADAQRRLAEAPGLVNELEAQGILLSNVVDVAVAVDGRITTIYVLG